MHIKCRHIHIQKQAQLQVHMQIHIQIFRQKCIYTYKCRYRGRYMYTYI